MPMKLFAHPESFKSKQILIAAHYAGLEIDTSAGASDTPDGKIPVLQTNQGCIFSSVAIARYISRIRRDVGLYGQNLAEGGLVDSWIEFCSHELEVPLCTWVYPVMGLYEDVPEATKQAKADVARALTVLDNYLLRNTWMVGHQITLADICLCCALVDGMSLVFDAEFRKKFGNLMRWFETCMAQEEFKAVIGKMQLCTKAKSAGAADAGDQKGKKGGKASPKASPKAGPKDSPKTGPKDKPSPKAKAKAEPKAKADKKGGKKAVEEVKEKTPEEKAADRKAQMKKVVKEGGKRGVEIEGAADMGGLQAFCTSVDEPKGDLEFLEASMGGMNEVSNPEEEERKGGSGAIIKMLFSAGDDQLAVCAYVPEAKKEELDAAVWLKTVLDTNGGEVCKGATGTLALGFIKMDSAKGKFPLKMKEPSITEAIAYLKKKGLFPDTADDSDDDYVFGDDDFPQ